MLSGEDKENGEKTTIGLISKKATLHFQHTLFVHFLAVVLHDYNVKLPEASWLHILWRKCYTSSCSLFFHCSSFSPRWPLAFLIFSLPLQNFILFLQQKMSPLFFLSRISSFSRWASLSCRLTFWSLFLCLSLSLLSKFVDMTIINLDNRVQKQFPLSVFVFIDSLVVSASQDVGGHTLSHQNNLTFGIGLNELGVRMVDVHTLGHNQIVLLSKVTNLS